MRLDSRRLTITLAALGVAAVAMTAIAVPRRPSAMPSSEAPVTGPLPVAAVEPVVANPGAAVAEAAPKPPAPATTSEIVHYGEAGMRVELDPETGMVGPARAEPMSIERSEAEALSRSTEGLREVVLPDGSVMIDLQGRFQEYVVMEVGPDGKRRMRCVPHPAVARPEAELK